MTPDEKMRLWTNSKEAALQWDSEYIKLVLAVLILRFGTLDECDDPNPHPHTHPRVRLTVEEIAHIAFHYRPAVRFPDVGVIEFSVLSDKEVSRANDNSV